MFIGSRRAILIGVIVAIVAFIVLFPVIPDLLKGGSEVKDITIGIQNVTIDKSSIVNESIPLKVTFRILNQGDKALSTSRIEYSVNANNTHLGNGILSYEDIPPNGRPQLYPNSPATLESTILLSPINSNSLLFDKLHSGNFVSNATRWNVNGSAQIDSAFTIYPVAFSSNLR